MLNHLNFNNDFRIRRLEKFQNIFDVANMKLSIVSYKRRKCVYVGSLESSQLGQSN